MKTLTIPRVSALQTLGVFLASLVFVGCTTASPRAEKMDIVDTAVSAGNFNTLVTAVKEAGLVDTLKGDGPFTVFAPTDEAFAKIPSDKLNALLADKGSVDQGPDIPRGTGQGHGQ